MKAIFKSLFGRSGIVTIPIASLAIALATPSAPTMAQSNPNDKTNNTQGAVPHTAGQMTNPCSDPDWASAHPRACTHAEPINTMDEPMKSSPNNSQSGCGGSQDTTTKPPKKKTVSSGGTDNGSLSTYKTAPCGG